MFFLHMMNGVCLVSPTILRRPYKEFQWCPRSHGNPNDTMKFILNSLVPFLGSCHVVAVAVAVAVF